MKTSQSRGRRRVGVYSETSRLLLEETAKLIHHVAAAVLAGGTAVGTALSATGAGVALVLLDSILGDAANDGSTDCSEEAVIRLVSSETTGGSTRKCASESTLTILSLAGSLLLIISRAVGVLAVTLLLTVLVLLLLTVGLLFTILGGLLRSRVVVVGGALTLLLVVLLLAVGFLAVATLLTVALLGVTLLTIALALLAVALALLVVPLALLVVIAVARHDVM